MTLYETATEKSAWMNLPRGVLRVQGRDAQKWLHKIVTADAQHLKPGRGAYSALLDAKGHFVVDFILLRDADAYDILVEPNARELLYNALRRYIIRDKVTLTDVSGQWDGFTFVGNQSASVIENVLRTRVPTDLYAWSQGRIGETVARVIRSARARVPAYDVIVPKDATPDFVNALSNVPRLANDLLETLRVQAGLPKWGVDFDATTLALEIPDVMQIRVDQGCYIGQEIVARIVHRGHVNRHLRGLLLDGDELPARGETIQFENTEVGAVTSAANSLALGSIALGYVRREVEPGAHVQIKHLRARVVELPFPLA